MSDGSSAGQVGTAPGTSNLFAAAVIDETSYIAVGDRGKILLSGDGAKTWKTVPCPTKQPLVSVCFPDSRNGWITGQGGVILHSGDGGATWQAQRSGVDSYLMGCAFADGERGCAVGEESTVLVTTDGGVTWNRSRFTAVADDGEGGDSGSGLNLFAASMMDPSTVCVVGDRGRIFLSEDAGATWNEMKSPLYDEEMGQGKILYCLAYDSGTLHAVGVDGAYVYSKDRGRTWIEGRTGYTEHELYAISFAQGVGVAGGAGGHVVLSSDGGMTWKALDVPEKVTRCFLSGIALKKSRQGKVIGLLVGQNGTVGYLAEGEVHW